MRIFAKNSIEFTRNLYYDGVIEDKLTILFIEGGYIFEPKH